MENALRACCKGIKIGKVLDPQEGDNGHHLIYEKLPQDIPEQHVLLLDPILGTGFYQPLSQKRRLQFHVLFLSMYDPNSAVQAISLLIRKKDVPEPNIIFLNLISVSGSLCAAFITIILSLSTVANNLPPSSHAPQGGHMVCKSFPRIKIGTSEIDISLNKDFRLVPGMGEFGDRYFGTDNDDLQS
ncbi:hypothetical protein MLD38_034282 [Melastoma candidum]|uniref:Uncharacterized protein n=1 Tax=Melastoma candidum TaxID=119954 RepID=A0ACB9MBS2_9MYRT|nr:hypothetical protein MLD38_034282 [Melastoma candidum]